MRGFDVIVVGAGPGGSAVAILLAEQGHSVLVLGQASAPRSKLGGAYLSPEASRILDRLGVLKAVDEAGAAPIRGIRITAPDGTVLEGSYPCEGPYRGYRDHGLILRRLTFDEILLERVKVLPVDVREGSRVEDLLVEEKRVVGVQAAGPDGRAFEFRSRLVIGADGGQAVVARRLGLVHPDPLRRLVLVAHLEGIGGVQDRGEIYVDPPDYAVLIPVSGASVTLSLVVPPDHAAPYAGRLEAFFFARLKQLDHLRLRLGGTRPLGPVAAFGPGACRVAPSRHDGVLFVGAAAGFSSPFAREGIYTALRSAEFAAAAAHGALDRGDCSRQALAPYWDMRRRAFRDTERLTRLLRVVIGRRWLANFVAHRLARDPHLLSLLMGVFGDYVPPRALLSPLVLLGPRSS